MAFCSSCGTSITEEAKFCKGCGAAVFVAPVNKETVTMPSALGEPQKKVYGPSADVATKQNLNDLWKLYIVIALTLILSDTLLNHLQFFPDSEPLELTEILIFCVVWYGLAILCIKVMGINKERPGWVLSFMILNIALFMWYVAMDDGAIDRLSMLPDLIAASQLSLLKKLMMYGLVLWSEALASIVEIIIMYKIFIVLKINKEKKEL